LPYDGKASSPNALQIQIMAAASTNLNNNDAPFAQTVFAAFAKAST